MFLNNSIHKYTFIFLSYVNPLSVHNARNEAKFLSLIFIVVIFAPTSAVTFISPNFEQQRTLVRYLPSKILELSHILVAVRWHNSVIMVTSDDQHCWVLTTFLDVVER